MSGGLRRPPLERLLEGDDPDAEIIDGFTADDLEEFMFDGVVRAHCTECGDEQELEPDARRYRCHSCGAVGSVTSPLVKLGLI